MLKNAHRVYCTSDLYEQSERVNDGNRANFSLLAARCLLPQVKLAIQATSRTFRTKYWLVKLRCQSMLPLWEKGGVPDRCELITVVSLCQRN
jgi:hypothetical protein